MGTEGIKFSHTEIYNLDVGTYLAEVGDTKEQLISRTEKQIEILTRHRLKLRAEFRKLDNWFDHPVYLKLQAVVKKLESKQRNLERYKKEFTVL